MVHLHDGRDALSSTEPQHRHVGGCWHRIAIERHYAKDVPRKREAADLGRARIEHMEQHALTLLHTERLASSPRLAVYAEQLVADLVAFGRALGLLVSLGPELLKLFDRFARCEHVHGHVAATAERR